MKIICEQCGNEMIERQGKKGKFYGCTGYPDCTNTKPISKPKPAQATAAKKDLRMELLQMAVELTKVEMHKNPEINVLSTLEAY